RRRLHRSVEEAETVWIPECERPNSHLQHRLGLQIHGSVGTALWLIVTHSRRCVPRTALKPCEVYAFNLAERLGGADSSPWQRRGRRAIKKNSRSNERRGRGSCEKIGIKRYSLLASLRITARRGGRAIQKISRSIRLSRGRGGFPMNPKGKPPRLRLLRWHRQIFFDDAATHPCGSARRGITHY